VRRARSDAPYLKTGFASGGDKEFLPVFVIFEFFAVK